MGILKLLIFIFLIVPFIDSINVNCPNSFCGNSFFSIKHPFKLQGQQPFICSDYISLRCTSQNDTILSLPFCGDFYVFDIIYYTKSISLYDPQDCLPKRLMNLNLSSSPFAAIRYQNYTFYNCPITEKLFSDGFEPINCLGNYPNATVASSNMSPGVMMKIYGCNAIVTAKIPVKEYGQFDGLGIYSNLKLTWGVPSCKDCDESEVQKQDKSRSQLSKYIALISTFLGLLCFGSLIAARILANKTPASTTTDEVAMTQQTTTSVAVMPPRSAGGGAMTCPDEHYLKTMTISTFLEGNFGPLEAHGDQDTSCTICLEEYSSQDKIRCLALCHHYFHAKCIGQWLQKNSSCPVCRTSILDVKL